MKISEHFRLGLVQAELDFVDVDTEADMPLFIDPYVFSTRTDIWSQECDRDIVSFFQTAIDFIRTGQEDAARLILNNLSEPNETCLGLSSGRPSGRGVSGRQALDLHDALANSKAAETGLLSDLTDCELFVDGIGRDKISDITTNIIRRNLIRYTTDQCQFLNIPLSQVASGRMWNAHNRQWEQGYVSLPVVDGRKILLVPKAVVRWSLAVDHQQYYNHFVLNFLQEEHLSANSGLVRILRRGGRRVYKKDLKELHPLSKMFLQDFSAEHPEVLQHYKRMLGISQEVELEKLDEGFDETIFARVLIDRLAQIPPGNAAADQFHKFMIGALAFIFYPDLIDPIKEDRIHEGRKRIDITYVNFASDGFFFRRRAEANVIARNIIVECKNYSHDVGNPELDQVSGRFSPIRGWFGFLIARTMDDPDRFMATCRDTARDGRGFVIPLIDQDLVAMLTMIEQRDRASVDRYLERKFRGLLG